MALDQQLAGIQDQLHSVEILLAQKHEPGRHDQKRHGRVTVTRAGAKLPAGEYDSEGVGWTRSEAEKLMNKLAGTKNYKEANDKGWFTVKFEEAYHIINTKKGTEPKPAEPPAATKTATKKRATTPVASVAEPATAGAFSASRMGGNGSKAQKEEAARILNLLPKEHADRINAVDVDKGRYLKYGGMRVGGMANEMTKKITVAGGSIPSSGVFLRTTVAHEAGHLVFANGLNKGLVPGDRVAYDKLKALWQTHKQNGTLFTHYSQKSSKEYMAECYGYYVVHPGMLKEGDSQAYDVMREFFNGQEYEEQ